MQSSTDLQQLLRSIDHKSYPAYKSLKEIYRFPAYTLSIDHVQGDPFASPSHISVQVPLKRAGFPARCFNSALTRTALADYLLRQFAGQVNRFSFRAKGSGKSGLISVSQCGPEVLVRSACQVDADMQTGFVTARFCVGFPANGRSINAKELEKILFDFLPVCVEKSFYYRNLNAAEVAQTIDLCEDQDAIRKELKQRNLVAFVADGAILPRESGVSSRPMKGAKPFTSPERLRVTLSLPHRGTVTGMGIPQGITLIVGGGYHGKSTLLHALDMGVYNHVTGDGREYVLTDDTALKLRSEDGRFIKDVDISMFINDLPNHKDTSRFSTEDASGSTSQAAGIVEGIEAGSRVFLLDEDTSATNFMVRDAFMQRLIAPDKEPITPFLERARDLYTQTGISTVLVAGSSGAFFHIADTVIQMDSYAPVDITEKAKALCREYPIPETPVRPFQMPTSYRIMTSDPKGTGKKRDYRTGAVKGEESLKIKLQGKNGFSIGKQTVDLRYIEQLIDSEQTATLGLLLKYAVEKMTDSKKTLPEIVASLEEQLEQRGLVSFFEGRYLPDGYAIPRIQEIYSCFNRYRRA
ncbi:isopentenyl-diphosphate delta-isomerase [Lachnospiraceae bacterium OF09-6]|nr:isopentenyl-diphosphate delta-isomerase [Lachnospiraceae bacterium OF09-6]